MGCLGVHLQKLRAFVCLALGSLQALTNRIEFKDTADGLMVRINIVLGVPPRGYDSNNPDAGSFFASTFNDMLMGPLIESFRNTPDLDESMNAVIRHMIEEYSNLRFFLPELYGRYSKMGAAGVTWIPTLGTFLDRMNLTASDTPTVNFYQQLRGFVEGMPKVDISDTSLGQAIIQKADAISNTLNYSPISARYGTATPEKIKQPPEFDTVVRMRDDALGTVSTMTAALGSSALASAMATLGESGTSESQNALSRLTALQMRASGVIGQIQESVGGLNGMLKQQVVGKVSAGAVELANNAAQDIQVKAYQLSLMRDAMMAILRAAKGGVAASKPAVVVREQPQSSVQEQQQSSVREQPQNSVREQPQSSTVPSKSVMAKASATLPLGPAGSLGIQFDASFEKGGSSYSNDAVSVTSDQLMSDEDLAALGSIFSGGMFAGLADSPQPQGGVTVSKTVNLLPSGPIAAAESSDEDYHDDQYYYDDDPVPQLMATYNMESAALQGSSGSSSSKGVTASAAGASGSSKSSSKSSIAAAAASNVELPIQKQSKGKH